MRVLHRLDNRSIKQITAKGVSFDMLRHDPAFFNVLASKSRLESLSLVMADSEETMEEPIEEVLNNGNLLAMLGLCKLSELDLRAPPSNIWSGNDHWPSALILDSCLNDKIAPDLRRLRLDSIRIKTPRQLTDIIRARPKLEEVCFGGITTCVQYACNSRPHRRPS